MAVNFVMIITSYMAQNLSTNSLFLHATTAATAAYVWRDRSVLKQPRSCIVIGQYVQRLGKVEWAWMEQQEINLAVMLWKQHHLSRDNLASVAASFVTDCIAVDMSVTLLIVAADMSADFPFRQVWYLQAGFILVTLFHFILSRVQSFCSYAPFNCKFSDFILNVVTHNFIATDTDIFTWTV